MKTTADIPDDLLREAMRWMRAKTKREAIVTALQEMNRRHAMADLVKYSGTFSQMMSVEELMGLRNSDQPLTHRRAPSNDAR